MPISEDDKFLGNLHNTICEPQHALLTTQLTYIHYYVTSSLTLTTRYTCTQHNTYIQHHNTQSHTQYHTHSHTHSTIHTHTDTYTYIWHPIHSHTTPYIHKYTNTHNYKLCQYMSSLSSCPDFFRCSKQLQYSSLLFQ